MKKEKTKKNKTTIGTLIWIVVIIVILNLYFFGFFSEEDYIEENGVGGVQTTQEQSKQKEITYYIDSLPYGIDGQYLNTVREGISYWEKRENVIFKESLSQAVDVRVQWVKEFGGEHLGYAYNKEFIEIGLGDSFCLGKWQPYQYKSVLVIATHEFGHVVGKGHSSNSQDIMYTPISTKYETDIEESEVLPDGWNRFYPTCTREDVSEYLFEVTSDEPLNVYIVPSKEEFDKLNGGESFNHYVDCFLEETTHYKKSCVISSGGGIILQNPTIFAIGPDAQFTIIIKEI